MPGSPSSAPRKRWFPETQRTTTKRKERREDDKDDTWLDFWTINLWNMFISWNIQTWAGRCFLAVLRCIRQSPEWTWPPRPPWRARLGPDPPGLWWRRCWTEPPGARRQSTTTHSVWARQLRLFKTENMFANRVTVTLNRMELEWTQRGSKAAAKMYFEYFTRYLLSALRCSD